MNLTAWAIKWRVPFTALADLREQMGMVNTDPPLIPGLSESAIQSRVRLEASRQGKRLWRNNVGAGYLEDGSFIRWGLANDSERLNKKIKSSDLIGIDPVIVRPDQVGHTLGVFMAREVKQAGWQYSGTAREEAQLKWLQLIASLGGDAAFTTGEGGL